MKIRQQKLKTPLIKKIPKICSIGKFNICLSLKFDQTFSDIHKIDFNSINTLKQLSFLSEDKKLWDNIVITSNCQTMNFLIFLNKAEASKTYIEFLPIGALNFFPETEYFKDIINAILKKNNILLLESNLCESEVSQIIFEIKNGENRVKRFKLTNCAFKEKLHKFNNNNINNNNTNSNNASKIDESSININLRKKNSNMINIQVKIDESTSHDTFSSQKTNNPFFSISSCDFQDFDYIYFDINDFNFKPFSPNLGYILEFIEMLKTNTNIMPIVNFPLKFSLYNEETLTHLLKIFTASDVLLFEEKNCFNLLNILYQIKKDNFSQKSLERGNMYSFFARDILKHSVYSFKRKICIFIDNFSKITFLEISSNSKEFKYSYDFTLYPKVNHVNMKSVNDYKNKLNSSYEMYMGIITGTCLGRMIKVGFSSANFYSAYLVSLEETKKILELYKNKFDLPANSEFYLIKIPEGKLLYLKQFQQFQQREKSFVLDCVNKLSSKIYNYHPLLDRHLNSFFSSGIIRRDLQQRGLIDDEGYIVNDPVYKNSSLSLRITHSKSSGHFAKRKMPFSLYKKQKFLDTIQNLNLWKEPKNKELDVIQEVSNSPTISNKKLPKQNKMKYSRYLFGKEIAPKIKLKPIHFKNSF